MGRFFDFGNIKNYEKTIRKTWDEFRDALAMGNFSYDDIEIAKKYTFLNHMLESYGNAQVKKGVKIAKILGRVPQYCVNKTEFKRIFTEWAVYTYSKLLSEQIFEPIDDSADKGIMYAPFQTMAQYYRSLGYSGIIYGSTVSEVGRNIVLFDKIIAKPCGSIEKYTIS